VLEETKTKHGEQRLLYAFEEAAYGSQHFHGLLWSQERDRLKTLPVPLSVWARHAHRAATMSLRWTPTPYIQRRSSPKNTIQRASATHPQPSLNTADQSISAIATLSGNNITLPFPPIEPHALFAVRTFMQEIGRQLTRSGVTKTTAVTSTRSCPNSIHGQPARARIFTGKHTSNTIPRARCQCQPAVLVRS